MSRVAVDGRRASFTHSGQELSITPKHKLKPGKRFRVEVDYAGAQQPIVDPDETFEGWVVPTTDPDEGFATWSEWIYDERHGGQPVSAVFDGLCAVPEDTDEGQDLWFPAPAALPGPAELFHTPVYYRGGMTLQALRELAGDETFFSLLRAWYREHRGGNVTTADFIALAERKTGLELDSFFDEWLYQAGRPAACDA